MTKKILGIYLRPNAFKVIELLDIGTSLEALNAVMEYFPVDDSFPSFSKTILSSFQKNNISTREAILSISGDKLIYKLVSLPIMPESDIKTALGFKLGVDLLSEQGVILDYYKINGIGTNEKIFYFVVYVPKVYIENILKQLKKADIVVKDVVPYSCALRSAFPVLSNKTCAIIKVDKNSTIILLLKNGMPVFAREVSFGGDNVAQALSGVVVAGGERVEIDNAKALEILTKYGIPMDLQAFTQQSQLPANEIVSMLRPALEKIGAEVLRTFEYYKNETSDPTEFKEVYLTGSFSVATNFAEFLSQELERKVEILKLPIKFKNEKNNSLLPTLSVAYGAVYMKQHVLSLLPQDYKKPIQALIKRVANIYFFLIAYVLVLALVYLIGFAYNSSLNAQFETLKKQASDKGVFVVDNAGNDVLSAFISKFGDPKQNKRFVMILDSLAKFDKEASSSIYFSSMEYDAGQNQLTLKGVILKRSGRSAISVFMINLKRHKVVASVDLSFLNESDRFTQSAYEFEVKCKLAKVN